ncbi:hypothetical protein [Streptomyces sp. NPDC101206]|uniref:hypothetical protein n=1 Tax=Streptomyces sp. NPDC101206 TaxID=3366128 RepID=UPI0037FF6D6A
MAGAGLGKVLSDLPGHIRAQRYGPADRAQPARLVQVAENEETGAAQGAGHGAYDRLSGVSSSDLGPPAMPGQITAGQGLTTKPSTPDTSVQD